MEDGGSPSLDNIQQHKNFLQKIWGINYYQNSSTIPGTAPGTPILHMTPYYQDGVFQYYIAFSTAKTYKIIGGTYTELFTQAFSAADPIDTADWLNNKYVANPDIQVKYWTGSALTAPAGWANITAGCIAAFRTHLVVGNTIESSVACRQRVRWSAIGLPNDTTATTSGFVDLIDTPGEVVALKVLGDRLFVLKTDAIFEGIYVGGTDTIKFVQIKANIGIAGKDSVTVHRDLMFLLTREDVYRFDGREFSSIGQKVKDFYVDRSLLQSSWNTQYAKLMVFEARNELWVGIPNDTEFPSHLFILDLNTGVWWKKELGNRIYSMLYTKRINLTPWSSVSGTWAAQTLTWDSATWGDVRHEALIGSSAAALIALFNSTSNFGTSSTGYWTSKELVSEVEVRFLEVNAEIEGSVECLYSIDSGTTWTSLGAQTSTGTFSKTLWEINTTAKKMMFKFVLGSGDSKMKSIVLAYQARKGWRR